LIFWNFFSDRLLSRIFPNTPWAIWGPSRTIPGRDLGGPSRIVLDRSKRQNPSDCPVRGRSWTVFRIIHRKFERNYPGSGAFFEIFFLSLKFFDPRIILDWQVTVGLSAKKW
jgi:hypothetical protein